MPDHSLSSSCGQDGLGEAQSGDSNSLQLCPDRHAWAPPKFPAALVTPRRAGACVRRGTQRLSVGNGAEVGSRVSALWMWWHPAKTDTHSWPEAAAHSRSLQQLTKLPCELSQSTPCTHQEHQRGFWQGSGFCTSRRGWELGKHRGLLMTWPTLNLRLQWPEETHIKCMWRERTIWYPSWPFFFFFFEMIMTSLKPKAQVRWQKNNNNKICIKMRVIVCYPVPASP